MPVREWPADSIEAGIAQCVTACDALVTVSEDCADACLATEGNGEVTACFLADLDCVEICTTTTRVLSWHTRNDGPTAVAILETCREACMASTAACERMMALHPSWRTCSMACRQVSDSCTRLLALLGHREE
ncbi:four-helix bundle copper-binding protein [Cryobacterium algoritolerans]|uniref:Four-helix bundle copper-binding protein n=1 Tax=Cryobacterium algoritolerans TaxID=1259184 RepID=A0A4R8WXZ4_9MICO|nr:four-helix bundle copper-binding protein [Cryobacterium algoritolerans]TFC18967.1 four-helix bundle copper-binding protein [Cryobacterium algoritolerans]